MNQIVAGIRRDPSFYSHAGVKVFVRCEND
jgi:hypothetical protein